MASKKIIFEADARKAMKAGIDILARAVSTTLGPRGRSVITERGYGSPQVTFDGVTVAKEVKLADPFQNLGAELVKQAAEKTNDNVGDGTTTSIVLAHSLIDESEKYIDRQGVNVIKLADWLQVHAEAVIKLLEASAEPVTTQERIAEVATLSSKNPAIGAMIAEVMQKAGKDGVVTVDDSNTMESFYEMVEGLSFDRGYISNYFITDQDKQEAVLTRPYILVTDRTLSNVNEMLPMLEKIIQTGRKDLVIIAENVDGEALATLIVNKLRGTFNIVAIKAPGFGDNKKELLRDIAIVTGSKLVSEETGDKLEEVKLEDLGEALKVVVNRDLTTIVGGTGNQDEINKRIESIKAQAERIESGYEKEKLTERVGKISGGVTVIKVGAPTESAQKELKQRVEDAVAATKAAMDEGIVPGGGIALFNAAYKFLGSSSAGSNSPEGAAKLMLYEAMQAPLRQIVENSGESYEEVSAKLWKKGVSPWTGFNASTNGIVDLNQAGIVDPLKVTKTALKNAVSVAANYLTIGAAIVKEQNKDDQEGSLPGGF